LPKHQGPLLEQNTFRLLKNPCRIILKARNAILYIHETGKADFVDGKMIFLQGSPVLEEKTESIWSIIRNVAHFIPKYLQKKPDAFLGN
jgi:bacterioferritin (cytochrome b1)